MSMESKLTKEQRTAFYNSVAWRQLRNHILDRDNHECQWCKANGLVVTDMNTVLEVDHIKELEYYPELRFDEDNLRTLCKDCHNKRHGRMNYRSNGKGKHTNKWKDDERWD